MKLKNDLLSKKTKLYFISILNITNYTAPKQETILRQNNSIASYRTPKKEINQIDQNEINHSNEPQKTQRQMPITDEINTILNPSEQTRDLTLYREKSFRNHATTSTLHEGERVSFETTVQKKMR